MFDAFISLKMFVATTIFSMKISADHISYQLTTATFASVSKVMQISEEEDFGRLEISFDGIKVILKCGI